MRLFLRSQKDCTIPSLVTGIVPGNETRRKIVNITYKAVVEILGKLTWK